MSVPALSTVQLAAIDDGKRWNLHPFLTTTVSNRLIDSCRRIGILTPPVVIENDQGRHELLDGRQRIAIARDILNLDHLPCRILPAARPPQVLLAALFESQSCTAPLSPMETAYFLELVRVTPFDDEQERALLLDQLFPCKLSKGLFQRSEQLLRLEENLQELVHTRFLSEAMATDLLKLTAEDRQRLAGLFRSFEMGAGKQKRFFTLARDIARRNGVSITTLLEQPPLVDILQHRGMNQPQKAHSMLLALQELASPSLAADEEAFRQKVASLSPPPECSIYHSQSFETDDIDLTIRFGSFDELLDAWPAVQEIVRQRGKRQR